MVKFSPQENPKVGLVKTLKVGDCFSVDPIGDDDFEIFIVVSSKPNTILTDANKIAAVSLKTGNLLPFTRELVVYPLDLQVTYNCQYQ